MKKVYSVILFMAVMMSSCDFEAKSEETSEKENVISTEKITEETKIPDLVVTTDEEKQKIEDDKTASYDIMVDTIEADLLYDTKIVTLPENIDGKDYDPCGYYNDKIIVSIVEFERQKDIFYEYYIIDSDTNDYEVLIPRTKSMRYICSYEKFHIFYSNQGEVPSLQCYDFQNGEYSTIFNYLEESDSNYNFSSSDPVIFDGKLYFDVYKEKDTDGIPELIDTQLYEYDFESKNLVKKFDHATVPMISSDGIKYVNYDCENKKCDKIITVNDESELDISDLRLSHLVGINGEVYGITNKESVDKYGYVTQLQRLESDNNDTIFSTISGEGEILESLVANDFCVAWRDETGSDSTPCVYDVSTDKIVIFDNMEKCYYRTLLQQGKGMIYDVMNFNKTHQVCLFDPKEN